MRVHFLAFFLFLPFILQSQTGSITGIVTGTKNGQPIFGASVLLLTKTTSIGTTTDINGQFKLKNVPFGNHELKVSFVGFEEFVLTDLGLYDSKGLFEDIKLKESITSLGEIEVNSSQLPHSVNDQFALVSARKISIEETKRFAGGLGDPSRLALSYAGVNSGRGDDNDLIVRGNAAKYLKWYLEGLEIPNPNHFGTHGSTGGLFNILNSDNLGSSDFYLGSVPAHTGNTLSGLFNLSIRNGNRDRHKHQVQVSLIGLSTSSEGPLFKNKNNSYLLNYRYSTLGFLKQLGLVFQAPEFQDLTFKVALNANNSVVSIYGFGGIGRSLEQDFFRKVDSTRVSTGPSGLPVFGFDEIAGSSLKRYNLGVGGIKVVTSLNKSVLISNHTNFSITSNIPQTIGLDKNVFKTFLESEGSFSNSVFRNKPEAIIYINDRATLNTGGIFTYQKFKSKLREGFADGTQKTIIDFGKTLFMQQSFFSFDLVLSEENQLVFGMHQTYFGLNKQVLVEPRLSFKHQFNTTSSLAVASGLHSTAETPESYLSIGDDKSIEKNKLGLTRSWQNVISLNKQLQEKLHFKAELYWQYLFDVPIAADSSIFSLINQNVSLTNHQLVNEGEGINYGIEVSLEKNWSHDYYFLINLSLFQSEYRLFESFYRKSKYSNGFIFNVLGGKQFRLNRNKFLGFNQRVTFSGGNPYIPVSLEESISSGREVRIFERAYFNRLPNFISIDFSLSYKWIKPKISHELKLDVFRLFEQNYQDEVFIPSSLSFNGNVSPATTALVQAGQNGARSTIIPVLYYKLIF